MPEAGVDISRGQFKRCLVGGTFDYFHVGHQELLDTAIKSCEEVEIWLTSDEMIISKQGWVQSWNERHQELESWIDDQNCSMVTLHRLQDEIGPAAEREDCDAIVCTRETRDACMQINDMRVQRGLDPLSIILVEHVLDSSGKVVSSSRIRAGEIDRNGSAWLDSRCYEYTLLMPSSADESLKQPLGTLHKGPEGTPSIAINSALLSLPDSAGKLVAVGDVCVESLREEGLIPDIAVVDGRTKRTDLPVNRLPSLQGYDTVLQCSNPAGRITTEFVECILTAINSEGTTIIIVDGEEDLAPLVLHTSLPLDAFVIYGQPDEGVVLCRSSEQVKSRCRERLTSFSQSVE